MIDFEKIKQLLEKEKLTEEEREFLRKQEEEIRKEEIKFLDRFPKLINWNFLVNIDWGYEAHFLKVAVRDEKRCIEAKLFIEDVEKLKKALEEFEKYHELVRLEKACYKRSRTYP